VGFKIAARLPLQEIADAHKLTEARRQRGRVVLILNEGLPQTSSNEIYVFSLITMLAFLSSRER
jgi:hypothetical protein